MSPKKKPLNDPVEIAVKKILNGHFFSITEIQSAVDLIKANNRRFTREQLLRKSNWQGSARVIAHDLAQFGYFFTMDEITNLGNPSEEYGRTVAHFMAENGYVFTIDQLIQLGNPADRNDQLGGRTIAILMAMKGHFFTFEELKALGDLKDKHVIRIAILMISHGFFFTVDELEIFGNPAFSGGWTLSHDMARNGFNFSVEDLLRIKNPVDEFGMSVADVMIFNNHKFSDAEKLLLEIDDLDLEYSAWASFNIRDYFEKAPHQPDICPKCGEKLIQSDVHASKYVDYCLNSDYFPVHDYSRLFLCNECQWWCVRESWAEGERGFEGDRMIVGIPRSRKKSKENELNPWEKLLASENAYFHDLKMPDDIYQMLSK